MPFIKPAYAQAICNPVLPWTCNKPGEQIIGNLIGSLLGVALVIGGLLMFGSLVIGGIQWITSGGEKTNLESARNRIIHAIVGLIILASTWALSTIVFKFLGISFPNFSIPTIGETVSTAPSGCIETPACLNFPDACAAGKTCRTIGGKGFCCP